MGLEILRMLIERRNKSIDKDYVKPASFDYLVDTKNNINDIDKVITSYLHIITKRPIEKGIVKIVITNTAPKAKINTYAGTCANFMIIAVFANEIASHFLYILTKKQTMLNIPVSMQ